MLATLRHQRLCDAVRDRGGPEALAFKMDSQGAGPAQAAALSRNLGLFAAHRGHSPARRADCPRRPALVRPARRFPHRSAGPGQGAEGQEYRDRADGGQGRILSQAAARQSVEPRRLAGRRHRSLSHLHPRAVVDHRQSVRPKPAPTSRPPASSATMRPTPISWSPPTRARRPFPTPPMPSPRRMASGWAMPSPAAAATAMTTRRWHHRARRLDFGAAAFPRNGRRCADRQRSASPASATCRATCSATACCSARPQAGRRL
jgi:hypothetical protein